MDRQHIREFVLRYLRATECHVIEQTPEKLVVKLSPEADENLTNRPFYWNFVRRTGTDPETMTVTFIWDELHEGAARLRQIMKAATRRGKFTVQYEQAIAEQSQHLKYRPSAAVSCNTWLCVNYKVDWLCDMQKSDICSLGISLTTGEIKEHFMDQMKDCRFTPKLPAHTFVREMISLSRAFRDLESWLYNHYSAMDHSWADAAYDRWQTEAKRLQAYYTDAIDVYVGQADQTAIQSDLEEQRDNRLMEIERQYKPQLRITVVNGGLFHFSTKKIGTS